MEMHQIRYFLAVARTLNFTRAAEECEVGQPSLTRAIQRLEEELGGQLFHRERSHTHLTALGRMMLPHLEQALGAAERAQEAARGFHSSRLAPLNLGVATTVDPADIGELMTRVSASLPGLQIDMRGGGSGALIEAALKGEFDVVLVAERQAMPERLQSWRLFRQQLCMVTQADHPLARAKRIALSDVRDEVWINCNDDSSELFETETAKAGQVSRFRHSAISFDQARGLISAGLGSAVRSGPMPELAGGFAAIPFDETMPGLEIALATVAGRRRSPAVEAVITAARDCHWPDR